MVVVVVLVLVFFLRFFLFERFLLLLALLRLHISAFLPLFSSCQRGLFLSLEHLFANNALPPQLAYFKSGASDSQISLETRALRPVQLHQRRQVDERGGRFPFGRTREVQHKVARRSQRREPQARRQRLAGMTAHIAREKPC